MDLRVSSALPVGKSTSPPTVQDKDARLMQAARELEASFLSEMLKHAGLGKTSSTFGGGVGEEQFSSLLRDAQAREMATSGGIGLAENLFHALKEKIDAQ